MHRKWLMAITFAVSLVLGGCSAAAPQKERQITPTSAKAENVVSTIPIEPVVSLPLPDSITVYPSGVELTRSDTLFTDIVRSVNSRLPGDWGLAKAIVLPSTIRDLKTNEITLQYSYGEMQQTDFPTGEAPGAGNDGVIPKKYARIVIPLTGDKRGYANHLFFGRSDSSYQDGPIGTLTEPEGLLELVGKTAIAKKPAAAH